jgi:endonuclease YncB( thermonuclease family)
LKRSLFVFCFMSMLLLSFSGADWEGKVIGVRDGRTIIVFDGKNPPVSVRLNGVTGDGTDAKRFLSETIFGKMVKVENEKRENDGGLSAEVIMPDGKSLNTELLKQGFMQRTGQEKGSPVQLETLLSVGGGSSPAASEKSAKKDPPSAAQHCNEPSPATGVRKWRDKQGNIHFSGTVGEMD